MRVTIITNLPEFCHSESNMGKYVFCLYMGFVSPSHGHQILENRMSQKFSPMGPEILVYVEYEPSANIGNLGYPILTYTYTHIMDLSADKTMGHGSGGEDDQTTDVAPPRPSRSVWWIQVAKNMERVQVSWEIFMRVQRKS